ncbi:MAG: hypothetical protein MOB07_10755, partial [Acidobacteria bacterium]|nr:hypothetical protein [Acidobacteriota bacterium]
LDYEHYNVAGDVIFKVEGDAFPTSQEDEEARVGSLAYAIKQLGNEVDAAEFVRCLNAICDGGDARSRQSAASHYYREIAERGVNVVLKEMALLAMQLAEYVIAETEKEVGCFSVAAQSLDEISRDREAARREGRKSLFEQELDSVKRLVSGNRSASATEPDEFENFLDQMLNDGFDGDDLASRIESFENLMQYDESGAIIVMSAHERTIACGRIDSELTAEDLPARAHYLAAELRREYAGGRPIEELWDDINAQIEVLYPVSGKTESGARFYSHTNRESQSLCREVLETLLAECQGDFHLTALRTNRAYREFHKAVRGAKDTKALGETMKAAYKAREIGALPLKHFTALTTASKLQRERLENAQPSKRAHLLLKEVLQASDAKLRYLSWAMYGANQPEHPVHKLPNQERAAVWQALKSRRSSAPAMAA